MHSIQPITTTAPPVAQPSSATTEAVSFKSLLIDHLQHVNSSQQVADNAVQHLASESHSPDPMEVLTAVQKADMSLQTMIEVRNQLLQAYEELKSMDL